MRTTLLPLCLFLPSLLPCQEPEPAPTKTGSWKLPVRELTAFKDGHAFVRCEAPVPDGGDGTLVLDELPTPVLGTFWPYALDGAELVYARAGRPEVTSRRPARDLLELCEANVGKFVNLDVGAEHGLPIGGRLLDVKHPEGGSGLLLLEHNAGTRIVPIARVRELHVQGAFGRDVERSEARARLELKVRVDEVGARVGVVYVQQGFRWIPSYQIDLDGDGKARVRMQATLVNDLVDIDGATVHLVVGVPRFAFADLVDPISLQEQMAQVQRVDQWGQTQHQFSNMLSNSLMTQMPVQYEAARAPAPTGADPKVYEGEGNEDLFVLPVRDVTLKKGERMVVPVATFELSYTDVYRLDVPIAPPFDYRNTVQDQRAQQLARELAAPKVRHVLRITNRDEAPLTTAPALVLRQGKVLAQAHLRYTPRGAETDLEINVAVDVQVDVDDRETGREPNVVVDRSRYQRVSASGTIQLKNRKAKAIRVEVERRILGRIGEVGQEGRPEQLDLLSAWDEVDRPQWWSWWGWPWWWYRYNGVGVARWQVDLQPGGEVTLDSNWSYLWQ